MADKGSGEKTEKPTDKKKKDGVKQGQVARSPDIAAWVGVLALSFVLPGLFASVRDATTYLLESLPGVMANPDLTTVLALTEETARSAAAAMLPMLGLAALVSVVSGVAQGGARPYMSRLKPKFSRMNPFAAIKRILGPQGAWELVKSLLKTAVVGILAWQIIAGFTQSMMGSGALPLTAVMEMVSSSGLRLIRIVAVAALVIGVADYIIAKRRVMKQMMMSRKEISDEYKQSEGDPALKGALRRRALANAQNRMMLDIPDADVVLVNPTHVAVAISYKAGFGAPRVVAKGAGAIAARIREVAADNRVPLVEDIPLARAIYKNCEIGSEIPRDLYTAVARILAFVMTLRAKGAAAGLHRAGELAASGR